MDEQIDIDIPILDSSSSFIIDQRYSMEEETLKRGSNFEGDIEELKQTFNSGKTKEESWRRSQLKALLTLFEEREDDIFHALKEDLGKHKCEAYRDEIGTVKKSVQYALDCLKSWMSGKKAELPIIAFPSSAKLIPEPLGLVYIISSWNFPFGLSFEPLIGAIAGGNVVGIKPSELAPSSSLVIANTINTYLDNKAIKVFQGGASVSQQLLQFKWDKIFFTGSAQVGRVVMSAAANHLTPVTLELGGKCPAVVDSLSSSWDIQATIKRILVGKFGTCAGQVCIGVDYILAEKRYVPTLVSRMQLLMKKMFGENTKESTSRIINKQHFVRLKNLLSDPLVKSSIRFGGSADEDKLFIEPTVLVDPPLHSAIMTEEIFGPLLPIITLEKIEDSVEFIKTRPKPLTIYAFTNDEKLKKKLISETSSGSITFNDTLVQYAADTIPFGGVGQSGYGKYHGKYSFDTFSHEKAILRRNFITDFWFRFPPWNDEKMQLLRDTYRYDYLGIVLTVLGLKKY